ncbi:FCD domain-containing protein [Enterobacteriaceae bacterium RIT697]|uniref:GntR family transcriptional regulator n=1 Tax=Pantoea endophytica TaxID=92488 RepID=UPI0012ADEC20|nr:GntR family transcriptional regulator [Pantoea endophytica]MRT24941.1 FCD domain-containing protein [Enterobacteriaceae bacterium RIT697]
MSKNADLSANSLANGLSTSSANAKETQSAIAYRLLKQRILDGALPAGTQLLEHEAAELLNMSRTPVREAMIRLHQDGMVDIRPRHGMRVLPISADDMQEIYDVLTALEGSAAATLAERGMTEQQKQELETTVAEMDNALARDDLLAWASADEAFHAKLIEFSQNKRMIGMVSQLWEQSHRARMLTLKMRPRPTRSNREHQALIETIASGKVKQARQMHENHRKKASQLLITLLRELGATQI